MEHLRHDLENSILKILTTIKHPLTSVIKSNLSIFSAKELTQLKDYLETWNLNPIYNFFQEKKQEYIDILDKVKVTKNFIKLKEIKIKERLETQEQQKELEMIDFDF